MSTVQSPGKVPVVLPLWSVHLCIYRLKVAPGQVDTHLSIPVTVSSPDLPLDGGVSICVYINWDKPRSSSVWFGGFSRPDHPLRGNEAAAAASFPLGLNGLRAGRPFRLDGLVGRYWPRRRTAPRRQAEVRSYMNIFDNKLDILGERYYSTRLEGGTQENQQADLWNWYSTHRQILWNTLITQEYSGIL